MHIYGFGSICRGEISPDSDVDLLAIVEGNDSRFDPSKYSIYSYSQIALLWNRGNPFAWHLAREARMLFSSTNNDYLGSLGDPSQYLHYKEDCVKFHHVFTQAVESLTVNRTSQIFDLSTIFLSIRNISTCFSLGVLDFPNFSRHSALALPTAYSLPLSSASYRVIERARILCTRSIGPNLSAVEIGAVISELDPIELWMKDVIKEAVNHGRV